VRDANKGGAVECTCTAALDDAGPWRSLSTTMQFLCPSSALVGSTMALRVWRHTTQRPLSSQREVALTTILSRQPYRVPSSVRPRGSSKRPLAPTVVKSRDIKQGCEGLLREKQEKAWWRRGSHRAVLAITRHAAATRTAPVRRGGRARRRGGLSLALGTRREKYMR